MSCQQIANPKYRNWVKAVLGLKYVKEVLEPFCDDIVKQQHVDILYNVKQKHNLTTVNCGLCDLRTLQPDHISIRKRQYPGSRNTQCPLGQRDCNCQYPGAKHICTNNICGAIYDEIIKLHASTPPAPYWKNTDAQRWCTEPWAVAKCFINAPGYTKKPTASEIDCSGLLHLFINNKGLQTHIHCMITGTDAFSLVRQHRNTVFHSENFEIEDADVTTYIDDMIDVLQDSKKLKHRHESKAAVQKLLQLKQHDFIITTSLQAEVRAAIASFKTLQEEIKADVEHTGSDVKAEVEHTGLDVKAEVKQTGSDVKADVKQTGSDVKADVKQTGSDVKAQLEQKGSDVKVEVERKGSDVKAEVERKAIDVKAQVEQKGSDSRADVEQKGLDMISEVEQKGSDVKADLEKLNTEVKETLQERLSQSVEYDQQRYSEIKKELQNRLMNIYKSVTKISALPLLPEEDITDIVDVYVPPLMTVEITKDRKSTEVESQSRADDRQSRAERSQSRAGDRQPEEVEIRVHDIFFKEGKPVKLIYVLGEAGSGKSTFCKFLVRHWCAAHSDNKKGNIETDLVNEIKKFDFLFYISLRHCSDWHSIEMMLKNVYSDPVLDRLLQNESEKCLVVLDGLDEWTPQEQKSSMFQAKGLPERDLSKHYTVITTSRPWKLSSLRIPKSETDQTIKLKGIDDYSVMLLTIRTVDILNNKFSSEKNYVDCQSCIQESPVSDICHVPMILQQVICLWFDNKINGTSKCAIYSSMLELFFEWVNQKDSECQGEEMNETYKKMANLQLPEYLKDSSACCDNKHLIHCLSYLAYETLFDRSKINVLIFTSSKFKDLKIPNDLKTLGLRTGILSEDRCVSFLSSRPQQSSFSFIHKSIQEYLAAVYIAVQFENMSKGSTADEHDYDVGKECLNKYLGNCKTVDDILDQSNVLIMLCGLETKLATSVSEYIYKIVAADRRVIEYRTKINDDDDEFPMFHSEYCLGNATLIENIQKCQINCIKELNSSKKQFQSGIYVGDIILRPHVNFGIDIQDNHEDILLAFENKVIIPDSVRSLYIVSGSSYKYSALKYFITTTKLTKFHFKFYNHSSLFPNTPQTSVLQSDEMVSLEIMLVRNASTLQCVDIRVSDQPKAPVLLVRSLPSMHQLISLKIRGSDFVDPPSHEECTALGTFITTSTRLQQISTNMHCKKYDKHVVDLSNHKQLQYVNFQHGRFCVTGLNTDKLDTFFVQSHSVDELVQLCGILERACNLKHLNLRFLGSFDPSLTECRKVTVTESLTRLLSSLTSLDTLELTYITFTDNIVTRPGSMKNLKTIKLSNATMSITTWYKFIDSLPELPHTVQVKTYFFKILDEDGICRGREDEEKTLKTALRYVSDKTSLFLVDEYYFSTFSFEFTTIKK